MELTKNQNGGQNYALHLFYRKTNRIARHNNIESNEKEVHIHCELERKPHKCPNCGCVTDCVHDYRVQVIKDIPSFGKFVYIHLRKRRYHCKCGKTMLNWLNSILNSFLTPITNGFTEGCNNKIKVLKRNAYGYQNFNRFRNRILHMFSLQKQKQVIA